VTDQQKHLTRSEHDTKTPNNLFIKKNHQLSLGNSFSFHATIEFK